MIIMHFHLLSINIERKISALIAYQPI